MSNKTSDKNVANIEELIQEYKTYNDLDGIQDLSIYVNALEHILAEREQKDKRILEMEEKMNADIMILIYELKQKDKQIQELEKEKIELKEYNKIVSDRIVEYKKNSISTQAVIDLIENETIDISGFECIAVEDLQELLEGEEVKNVK